MKKTALITGASMGIGLEFAHVFAKNGYDLYLVARSEDKLLALARELESGHKVKVDIQALDLSKTDSALEVFQETKRRKIDIEILVNNAGFGDFGMFSEAEWSKEKQMIDLNITALTHFTKLFLAEMLQRKSGKILNVASIAAFLPGPIMAVYFATKAYVLSFSEAISNELEGTGVAVTCLCPGPTESNFQSAANMHESKAVKGQKLSTAKEVAEYGFDSLMENKVVAIPGILNYIMANSVRFTPRFLVRKIIRFAQDKAGN